MLMQQQEADQAKIAKDTLKSTKFNTVGRKKRSIYDVFFNLNKSPNTSAPVSESGIKQPTFYVPLPAGDSEKLVKHHHQHRHNTVNPIRSIRSRSVCATDSSNNVRTLFQNADPVAVQQQHLQPTNERKKSNSFNPRESLEITSFLFNKLRLDRDGDNVSVGKSSTFTGRRESSDNRRDERKVS